MLPNSTSRNGTNAAIFTVIFLKYLILIMTFIYQMLVIDDLSKMIVTLLNVRN